MTLSKAREAAAEEARKNRLNMVIVNEGLYADEHAVRDEDGNSYGFCPKIALRCLYQFATVVEDIQAPR